MYIYLHPGPRFNAPTVPYPTDKIVVAVSQSLGTFLNAERGGGLVQLRGLTTITKRPGADET